MMTHPDKIAAIIREIAQAEIVPRFRMLAQEDIREKRPGDFVTVADVAAERALTRRLSDAAPGSVVLGEEAAHDDPGRLRLLGEAAPVWVIDPVDGTANFARGSPGFGVIVARVERAAVVAGWIYDPLADVMVTAERGGGAWSGDVRLAVDAGAEPQHMIGAAYGRTQGGQRASKALEASGRIARVQNQGCSALEYVSVAQGAAHFSLHSRSLPWDHAAGMLIVVEAGGVSGFLDGAAYDPRIADRAVLAAASTAARDTVRSVVGALA
jgi:fructose-1,6-bisphosphatase/inositol monophosphatase family enzyme